MPKPRDTSVLLGILADGQLDVYVRNGDQLHQAARIATADNVSAATMTTVMADLAEAFGWPKIAVIPTSEVSRTSEQGLPRAGGAAAPPVSRTRRGRGGMGGERRSRADMELQKQTVLAIVNDIPKSGPVTVPVIAAQVKKRLQVPGQSPETSVRSQLLELFDDGLVGRVEYTRPNGHAGYDWYGLPADSRLSVESGLVGALQERGAIEA